MARFGRGQPHAPIFLRAPLLAAVAAAALASPIHVVSLAAERLPAEQRIASVIFVRPPVSSVVPDRLPPQVHILLQRSRPPLVHVVQGRAPAAPIVSVPRSSAPHVVSLAAERGQIPSVRRAAVLVVRRAVTSVVPDRLAPQVHVTLQNRRPPVVHVTQSHAPAAPVVPPTVAPQVAHVVSLAPERGRIPSERRAAVVVIRRSVTSLVPDRLAVQVHVVGLPIERGQWGVERRATLRFVRPPVTSLVPNRVAPQLHVVLQQRRRPDPVAHVTLIRNRPVGFVTGITPAPHVISLASERFRPERRAAIVLVRPSVTSLVPNRLPVQVHVVSLSPERATGGRRAGILLARAKFVPAPAPANASPIHLFLQSRRAAQRSGDIIVIRTPLVPLAPQRPHVVSLALERLPLAIERRAGIIWVRAALVVPVPVRAPQIHIINSIRDRISGAPKAPAILVRGPTVGVTLLVVYAADRSVPRYELIDMTTAITLADRSLPRYSLTDETKP